MPSSWRPRPVSPCRDLAQLHEVTPRSLVDAMGGEHLLQGHLAPDVTVGPVERARSVALVARRPGTVCLDAARWVHVGGRPPRVVDVVVDRPVRARFGTVRTRCRAVPARDVLVLDGVAVTTALATATDLLHQAAALTPGEHPEHAELVQGITQLLHAGVDVEEVRTRVRASRRGHHRAAMRLLEQWETVSRPPDDGVRPA